MIPVLSFDPVIRQLEQVRIYANKSVIPPVLTSPAGTNNVTSVKIQPEASGPEYEVFSSVKDDWFLDIAYSSVGSKVVTLTIEDEALNVVTTTATLEVKEPEDDIFFSSDEKLLEMETDLNRYLPEGKNNFNFAHRSARQMIINWLMLSGKKKTNSSYYTAEDLLVVSEVAELARFWALEIIFNSISNKDDDHFYKKSQYYYGKRELQQTVTQLTLNSSTVSGQPNQTVQNNQTINLRRGYRGSTFGQDVL